jgi:hypothetical protein
MMDQQQRSASVDFDMLGRRLRRLLTLDTSVFNEIRMDRAATIPAIVVVVGSIFLFGIGGWLWWVFNGTDNYYVTSGEVFVKSTVLGTILATIFWAAWVGVTYVLLSQMFSARVDLNDLIRVMGFAAAPLALGVLLFIPALYFGIGLTVLVLFFGMNVIAVQSATDASSGRVLAAVGAGFLLWAVMLGLFVTSKNAFAPGFFIFDVGAELLS